MRRKRVVWLQPLHPHPPLCVAFPAALFRSCRPPVLFNPRLPSPSSLPSLAISHFLTKRTCLSFYFFVPCCVFLTLPHSSVTIFRPSFLQTPPLHPRNYIIVESGRLSLYGALRNDGTGMAAEHVARAAPSVWNSSVSSGSHPALSIRTPSLARCKCTFVVPCVTAASSISAAKISKAILCPAFWQTSI